MRLKSFTKLLVVFAVCLVPVLAFAEEAVKITDILVEGSKKIEAETIRSKMTVKPGDAFSPSRIRSDVSAIYKMGYFDDVKVEAEGYAGGIRLTIVVTERPILTSYSFEGNKELDSQKLREKVNLTAYSVYNPTLVQENVQKLKIFYQDEGYYNAEITPIIKRTSPKEIKVIFAIKEGDRVVISKVLFTGNDKISSRKLRKVMETKEHTFIWSWLTKSGTYKLNEFNQDMERIRGLYYNNGYLNVKIDEPVIILDDKKKGLTITIPVHEGDQFRLRDIKVVGNKIFSEKELIDSIASKPGQIMNRDQIRTDIITLTDLYGSKGYAFASISPIINTDNEKKAADITMDVSEGDKIFVSRINISGNVKTRDKVIRRELKFNEGEIYDTTSLKRSYERLHALEYFEDMEITPQRRTDNPDKVDLAVTVKEKSTGSFSIGGGYSTIDSLVGLGEVTQNNFLGRGQQLRVKGEIGSKRQNYVVSFTEPWLMDKPISLRVDLYKEERDYSGYKKRSTGGGLTLGKRFWEYYGINGSYNYSDERYFDVLTDIQDAFGDTLKLHTTSKVGFSFYRDSRDSYMDPRSGSNNSITAEFAGLGGQNQYYKVIGDTAWYFPYKWDTGFSLHARAGYAKGWGGKEVPLYERFYVGGIGTVRGFGWGNLGPKLNGQNIGGNEEIIANAEYTFPIVEAAKLRGVVFVDAGNSYDTGTGDSVAHSFGYSSGGGVRWTSPLGLLRLEYGHILGGRTGTEGGGKWEFSMGSVF